jgi:putative transposase
MAGLYTRLGIEEHYAKPYNGRAKPIERWFKTFNDNFERFLDNYRGSSIDKKPANLARNEKFLQKFASEEPLDLAEAQALISYYVSEYYHKMPHKSLGGATPLQVFSAFAVPEERRISAPQLNYLMLRGKEKTVLTQGIHHLHINYWHPKLSYKVGHKVIFRWDPNDMRTVLVYETSGKYICQATANKKLHPMISLDPNRELSQKHLERELAHQGRILRDTKKQAMATLSEAAKIDRKLINAVPDDHAAPLFHSERKALPHNDEDNPDDTITLKEMGL